MKKRIHVSSAVLVLLLALSGARAFALEFRMLSWSGSMQDLAYENQGRLAPITAEERSLSPVYTLRAGAPLRLHRVSAATAGADRREPELESLPPAEMTKAILLLMRDASTGGLSAFWIDDDEKSHPKGSLAFINFSGSAITLRADGDIYSIPASETRLHPFATAGMADVRVLAAIQRAGEDAKAVASCTLRVHPDYKILMLFREGRPDPGSLNPNYIATPVEFLLFYDYVPPPPKPE